MGTIRLLQLVAFAAFCLFALKTAGLMLSGGYVLSGHTPAQAQTQTQAQAGDAARAAAPAPADAGKSDQAKEPRAADADKVTQNNGAGRGEKGGTTDATAAGPQAVDAAAQALQTNGATKTELAVLQSLSNRRQALEKRQRELELRENLLKAAEKRVSARISELKSIEKRIEKELEKQDEERVAQHMRLVKMYASMKPKSAAEIFNRLDLEILIAMVKRMRPQAMAKILAAMDPAAARRLTTELAKSGEAPGGSGTLPKIGGGEAG